MTELEKVIEGIEACNRISGYGSDCQNCPYYDDEDASELPFGVCNIHDMLADALFLLKEREPKMVVKTTSTIRCPGCGKQITNMGSIHKEIKYCWKCGQAVKWE